jgi:hypothetical protein
MERQKIRDQGEDPNTIFSFTKKPSALPETLRFRSLDVPELPLATAEQITNFETARQVFLRAVSRLEIAKRAFPLDGPPLPPLLPPHAGLGFVTDHVQLVRQHSLLFHYLSAFETDTKRKLAMELRRAEMLRPFVDSLGRNAFEKLHKEISYELGEIFLNIFDLKLLKISEKNPQAAHAPEKFMKAADLEKCNEYCFSSVAMFSHFLSFYLKSSSDSEVGPRKEVNYGAMTGEALAALPTQLPSWGPTSSCSLLPHTHPLSSSFCRPSRRRRGAPIPERPLSDRPDALQDPLEVFGPSPAAHAVHGELPAQVPVAPPPEPKDLRAEASGVERSVRGGVQDLPRDDRPAALQDRPDALPGGGRAVTATA